MWLRTAMFHGNVFLFFFFFSLMQKQYFMLSKPTPTTTTLTSTSGEISASGFSTYPLRPLPRNCLKDNSLSLHHLLLSHLLFFFFFQLLFVISRTLPSLTNMLTSCVWKFSATNCAPTFQNGCGSKLSEFTRTPAGATF